MKNYAIVIRGNPTSENAYSTLQRSTKREISRFDAVTPADVHETMKIFDIVWNYPWKSEELDANTGLKKKPYPTTNKDARMACAMSHYLLWEMAVVLNEPVLVLEHDAVFTHELDFDIMNTNFDILGINDPRGATRLSGAYHSAIQENLAEFQPAPMIDLPIVPQGLAGNSAYIIKPQGARHMMGLVKRFGLWPNDALMCQQLVPRLGVTRKYYTKVQGTRSTTSL